MTLLHWNQLDRPEYRTVLASLLQDHKGTALTIGGFDGPHLGHESLFKAVKKAATEDNLISGVVTFTRSPGLTKRGSLYPGDVSTLALRLSRFEEKGFDFVLLIDFSGEFGTMSGGVFFDILVKTVRMRYVAVGPDFRCGHRLDTGAAEIAAIAHREGFRFDSVTQVDIEGQRVSSSAVRHAVQSADFSLAERLLGHPFLLDFTIPEWKLSGKGLEAAHGSFTQILPRRGSYRVELSTVTHQTLPALLRVTENAVFLDPATGQDLPPGEQISSIKFRLS